MSSSDRARIAALNDDLRHHLLGGGAVMTAGIAALGQEAVLRLVRTIATFDDFSRANDPHGEHDFGKFDFDGVEVISKIDYYDPTMTGHSSNPADPKLTERVITVMLAEEY